MSGSYISGADRLSFTDTGTGVPVVFLHPTPLDHDYWRPMTQALPGIRAIVPDLRGHGASELGSSLPVGVFARVPDAPALTVAQLAADILALLDHLELQNAVVAGCSIGGYVSLELWRQAPQRISGLAFICSKPQPDAEANLEKRVANIAQIRTEGAAAFCDAMAHSLVGATTRARRPQVVDQLRARMTLTQQSLVAVQAGLAARPDSLPTVPTIDRPVLAIAGGEDAGVAPAEMEAFRDAPGGCSFHLLHDAGHLAAYEQPLNVAALLSAWLEKQKLQAESL